ncbi:hypothetical protein ACFLS1_11680 [Verrucomicrobiota bacterium]
MKRACNNILFLFCFICMIAPAYGQTFEITNVTATSSNISMRWSHVTNLYILEERSSLLTGQWAYVGEWVLSTNSTVVTNPADICFYRTRKVRVIDLPDSNFEAAVRNDLTVKYYPTNVMYDIDVIDVSSLDLWSKNISSLQGINEFAALTNLDCSWNNLTNLDVAGNANLTILACDDNNLINLDVSANTEILSNVVDENFHSASC